MEKVKTVQRFMRDRQLDFDTGDSEVIEEGTSRQCIDSRKGNRVIYISFTWGTENPASTRRRLSDEEIQYLIINCEISTALHNVFLLCIAMNTGLRFIHFPCSLLQMCTKAQRLHFFWMLKSSQPEILI